MASAAAASDVTDGPVLTLINKRIRNLRKKLNRIAQLEESIAQGKSTVKNKEQEELLKSKPSIVAAVDELEKFRQPLSVAVDEEINLAIQHRQVKSSENNGKEVEGDSIAKTLDNEQNEAAPKSDLSIEDLLSLIYFGSMFDVKSQSDFSSIMLTRTHERNCCLMYDYITDDAAAVMLGERDLDLISTMGSLLISRPMNSSFSHQNALQRCIEHAKLWLAKSEQPIDSNSDVTYASLREKLAKIIGSDFFRITPAMKATVDVAAEAADSYGFQVPVQVENSVAQPERKEDDATDLQRNETGEEDQSSPVKDPLKHDSEEAEISVETHPSKEQYQYVPRRNFHNQRGGGGGRNNGGGGGGRRGGYGNGRGGRSGGRGGPYQNGGRNQYNDQEGNYYPRNNHGGRGRGGGRGGGGGGGHYANGGNNGYNHHASSGVEV